MCWRRPQETGTNVAHVVRFARVCSSNHFFHARSAIYFLSLFTCSSYVLRLGHQQPRPNQSARLSVL